MRQTILDRLRQTSTGDLDGALGAVHPAEMAMIADNVAMWTSVFDDSRTNGERRQRGRP